MKLYRVMKVDSDGKPLAGVRRNMLGVRPTDPNNTNPKRKFDVTAVSGDDLVRPGAKKGLSVSISLGRLFAGPGEAIWEIDLADLLPDLIPIPDHPPHHVLEPISAMTLDEYQEALVDTRDFWQQVP